MSIYVSLTNLNFLSHTMKQKKTLERDRDTYTEKDRERKR